MALGKRSLQDRLQALRLPEEEELRAWARGEREVQDWRDRIPDGETSDKR